MAVDTVRQDFAYAGHLKIDLNKHAIFAYSEGKDISRLINKDREVYGATTLRTSFIHPRAWSTFPLFILTNEEAKRISQQGSPTLETLASLVASGDAALAKVYSSTSRGIASRKGEKVSMANSALAICFSLQAGNQTHTCYTELAETALDKYPVREVLTLLLGDESDHRKVATQKFILDHRDELDADLGGLVKAHPWVEDDLSTLLVPRGRKKNPAPVKKYSLVSGVLGDTLTQELLDNPAIYVAHLAGVKPAELLLAHAKGVDMTAYAYKRIVKGISHEEAVRLKGSPPPVWFGLGVTARVPLDDLQMARKELRDLRDYVAYRQVNLDHATSVQLAKTSPYADVVTSLIKEGARLDDLLLAHAADTLDWTYRMCHAAGMTHDEIMEAHRGGYKTRAFLRGYRSGVPKEVLLQAHKRGVLEESFTEAYGLGITVDELEQAKLGGLYHNSMERYIISRSKGQSHVKAVSAALMSGLRNYG